MVRRGARPPASEIVGGEITVFPVPAVLAIGPPSDPPSETIDRAWIPRRRCQQRKRSKCSDYFLMTPSQEKVVGVPPGGVEVMMILVKFNVMLSEGRSSPVVEAFEMESDEIHTFDNWTVM